MISSTNISQTNCRTSIHWSGSVCWTDCCSSVTGSGNVPNDSWLSL